MLAIMRGPTLDQSFSHEPQIKYVVLTQPTCIVGTLRAFTSGLLRNDVQENVSWNIFVRYKCYNFLGSTLGFIKYIHKCFIYNIQDYKLC